MWQTLITEKSEVELAAGLMAVFATVTKEVLIEQDPCLRELGYETPIWTTGYNRRRSAT